MLVLTRLLAISRWWGVLIPPAWSTSQFSSIARLGAQSVLRFRFTTIHSNAEHEYTPVITHGRRHTRMG